MNREENLFLYIMEAETELASFDDGGVDDTAPPMDDSAPPSDDGADNPPDIADTGGDDSMESFDAGGDDIGGDFGSDDTGGEADGDQSEDGNKDDSSMSDKANNILNQKLYEQLCTRNDKIESVLEGLQNIAPITPHDIFEENEKLITKLKAALNKSKDYAITKFIDSTYGENLFFYNEINVLFNTLCDEIDKNLKKTFKKKK